MLCAYMRPRYKVSVYRTIGPLVFKVVWPLMATTVLYELCSLFAIFAFTSRVNSWDGQLLNHTIPGPEVIKLLSYSTQLSMKNDWF